MRRPSGPGGGSEYAEALSVTRDCFHDVIVAGAAADIALEITRNSFLSQDPLATNHVQGAHDHPRRAKSALQCVAILESGLQWMQLPIFGNALNGRNFCAIGLNC